MHGALLCKAIGEGVFPEAFCRIRSEAAKQGRSASDGVSAAGRAVARPRAIVSRPRLGGDGAQEQRFLRSWLANAQVMNHGDEDVVVERWLFCDEGLATGNQDGALATDPD